MSERPDFKPITAKELKDMREKRNKDFNSHDYENLPYGERGRRKLVYRPRRH